NNSMIDVLLSLQDSEPDYYTDEVIRGMGMVMLAAGIDTTASTMEWALSLLLNNPESSGECVVGGFRVPRGTMLLVNLCAIQNDAKLWEEPNEFKPERFMDIKGQRDGFRLMPFGYGRRGCPGENLAMHVAAGLALGSLIQCFECQRVSEELVDMTEGPGLTMPKAIPLLAKCRPRQNIDNLLSLFRHNQ
ncbi:hypothetical protein HAX54_021136, partial [Datura stramonium]|nr:hypothetical protein [Datura stramonium]